MAIVLSHKYTDREKMFSDMELLHEEFEDKLDNFEISVVKSQNEMNLVLVVEMHPKSIEIRNESE